VNETDDISRLARAIAEIFQKRILLDDDVLHFIDSTCSACSAAQIRAILDDPGNNDQEMIRRLIFSPDESIQSDLEPYVENIKPAELDLDALEDDILGRTQAAWVHLTNRTESFHIPIDHFIAAHFLSLLNLSATIDPEIADAMNRYKDQPFYWSAKVKLRNARVRFTEKQRTWMILFLTAVNCRADEFLEFFEFALEFVNNISDPTDIFRRLNDLETCYFNAVKRCGEYESRLIQTNMETMIAMGNRMPYVDKPDAIKKIYMIDHLCASLYGRTKGIGKENNLFTIFTGSDNY
jgi:hypothetical protein